MIYRDLDSQALHRQLHQLSRVRQKRQKPATSLQIEHITSSDFYDTSVTSGRLLSSYDVIKGTSPLQKEIAL